MNLACVRLLTVASFAAVVFSSADAAALQWKVDLHGEVDLAAGGMTVFYPYPTSYRQVSKRYAFDDDPLSAFSQQPYEWIIELKHVSVRRSMAIPRTSFVPEMYKSTEGL